MSCQTQVLATKLQRDFSYTYKPRSRIDVILVQGTHDIAENTIDGNLHIKVDGFEYEEVIPFHGERRASIDFETLNEEKGISDVYVEDDELVWDVSIARCGSQVAKL